jgi:hypothetical protein
MKIIIEIYLPITENCVYENVKIIENSNRDSIMMKFSIPKNSDLISKVDVLDNLNSKLISRDKNWFKNYGETLICDLNLIKEIKGLDNIDWLKGSINVNPEISFSNRRIDINVNIDKLLTVKMNKKSRIFLSHKSSNKELVREYSNTLTLLGYEPWIDENDMPAGTNPHRGILQGFEDSCAVIFFITNDFVDERFLATEINYAITEKTERGDDFAIITLAMSEEVVIPKLLRSYIWKSPKSDLEALREIIKALPIQIN